PRWRGEHLNAKFNSSFTPGLSPLARGTQPPKPGAAGTDRFIPAGAGNTGFCCCWLSRCAVYPRWRGEHVHDVQGRSEGGGLSPLARGTLRRSRMRLYCTRFIPAGAGNTADCGIDTGLSPVYPRWRGEHTKHTYLFLNKFIPHQQSTN
ncbi:hypothetical protein RW70_02502, partial [Escherichia coli]